MRLDWLRRGFGAALAVALFATPGGAAVVVQGDPGGPFSGIPYAWQVTLETDSDAATVGGFVGSKSWAHPMNPGLGSFGLDGGWTHTSNWMYLTLLEEREVRLELIPNDGIEDGTGGFWSGELIPAFSLWSGVDDEGMDEHVYTQGAVPGWIDAPGFAFLDAVDMGPGPFDGSSAELVVTLPAGEYTVAVGGHDDSIGELNVGYSFCVAGVDDPCPVYVPEPGFALQLLTGFGVLFVFRRVRA